MESPKSTTGVQRLRIAFLFVGWFSTSLLALFFIKSALVSSGIPEDLFTAWLLSCSVFFGFIVTKVLRIQALHRFNAKQLRVVLPLSVAYLVKEVLKYAALGRISVNLFNAVRSLAPIFAIGLEYVLFNHRTPPSVFLPLLPIIVGVTLTTVDELHFSFDAATASVSQLAAVAGLIGSILSTAINSGQNIYSKILFGRDRMDPVSLQIYLSAVSLLLLSPSYLFRLCRYIISSLIYHTSSPRAIQLPSASASALLCIAALFNFLSTQLAFNTLSKVSPLSYSVANNFKRVCVPVVAVGFYHEKLGRLNALGVVVSVLGIFAYERVSRSYKQSAAYELSNNTGGSTDTPNDAKKMELPVAGHHPP
eukprot:CAMPEP_0185853490 /NCGR_PEP_ID=MMETSP1354-20130828/19184_1 /TAXON_ID=708628 /ORGANISM="Erythrolobus madagascarensis, Strain CCMP3276" /LENGTH=363 /DNA_ID=CAMNT_0028554993 /DNA_START=86 /DNA_END=1177 /DNA_ORIENTATION=-